VPYTYNNIHYLNFWPEIDFLKKYISSVYNISTVLPPTLRLSRLGKWVFAFNYASDYVQAPATPNATFILGSKSIEPFSLSIWEDNTENYNEKLSSSLG